MSFKKSKINFLIIAIYNSAEIWLAVVAVRHFTYDFALFSATILLLLANSFHYLDLNFCVVVLIPVLLVLFPLLGYLLLIGRIHRHVYRVSFVDLLHGRGNTLLANIKLNLGQVLNFGLQILCLVGWSRGKWFIKTLNTHKIMISVDKLT